MVKQVVNTERGVEMERIRNKYLSGSEQSVGMKWLLKLMITKTHQLLPLTGRVAVGCGRSSINTSS